MENNRDEEEELESASGFKPPQFSLRTLMIVVTGTAIFCSLVAWLGYAVLFIFSCALGIFLGLSICSALGLGFGFEDLRWDIAKCFMVACVVVAPLYILPYLLSLTNAPLLSSALYVFAPAFFFWLGMQTAWNDLELPEIFITAVITFFTWAFLSYVAGLIFG
jgi:hypothetical protein